MSVFCYDTLPEIKRKFLFRIYDKEGKNEIPMIQIRSILTEELFVRSHYSEVQPGVQVKSSYSDRIMRDIMDDVMQKFDQDANKTIDYNEFKEIISDADVDLMFSLY
jgi:Ca2+-binding EF-hand superfamily protein